MRAITAFTFLGAVGAQVLESLPGVPQTWERVGSPEPTHNLRLRISMAQPNHALVEQTLYNVSDPDHPRYGQFLKRHELKAMLRPEYEATEAVMNWIQEAGVQKESIEEDGEWINFVTPVENAEMMLNTTFDVYRNQHGKTSIRTLQYSVPQQLHRFIDMIQPTTRFSQLHPNIKHMFEVHTGGKIADVQGTAPASCAKIITPACIRKIYNIDASVIKSNGPLGFTVFNNFDEEYPQYDMLADFERSFAPYAVGRNFTWTSINGGLLTQDGKVHTEANLDAQYLLSVGFPVPMQAYSTAGVAPLVPDLDQPSQAVNTNEPDLDWLSYVLGLPDDELPHTISTSYIEDEQSSPYIYRTTVCNMIGQLGARGVSVLYGSGDAGVGYACQSNDGKNTTEFMPIFPASCPYVTSVGGTHGIDPEQAIFFSSGGFSNTWARPAYQNAAVAAYLTRLGDKWHGLYNRSGRGFPDVAAQADGFQVYDGGKLISIGGTSASTPTFAGVVALLNAARIQAGKPPLGFLNPWIYSTGYRGLNDIVEGGSTGCTGVDHYSGLPTPIVPYASWNATSGWDPVTGYGTPNFQKLLPLALNAGCAA